MGKLIKKGLEGIKTEWISPQNVVHQPNGDVELYLERDLPPLPDARLHQYAEEAPASLFKIWTPGTTPEERMDQTVQELTPIIDPFTNKLVRLSTYQPTLEQRYAGTGTEHPTSWVDYVAGLGPLLIPALVSSPYWAPAAATTVASPAFWTNIATKTIPNLIKDTALYVAADAASEATTNRELGTNINRLLDLEDNHPIGDFIGFGGTSMLRRPIEKAGIAAYKGLRGTILPEYALSLAMNESLWKPYTSRVVGENGKIRLRLPSHTDATPREIVLEPQGNNKFYAHVRTWNDVDGKVPANLTSREIGYLYEALYNELPEGAEILFPLSGPGNYATRGTVAGLQRLARDPRFSKGSPGTLQYIDKDGSIKEFTGTSFIKTRSNQNQITYTPSISSYDNAPYWTPIKGNRNGVYNPHTINKKLLFDVNNILSYGNIIQKLNDSLITLNPNILEGLTPEEIETLAENLYNVMPNAGEIVFPKVNPKVPESRLELLQNILSKDQRYAPGLNGNLKYLDENQKIQNIDGIGFIKKIPEDDLEYIERLLIPFALQLGNWQGHSVITKNIRDRIRYYSARQVPISGVTNRGKVYLNSGRQEGKGSIYGIHELRHAFDTNPVTGELTHSPGLADILMFLPMLNFWKGGMRRPIKLNRAQMKLLKKAYPTSKWTPINVFSKELGFLRWEKIAFNAQLRKKCDLFYLQMFNRKPSVKELNYFVNNIMSDEDLANIIIEEMRTDAYGFYYGRNIAKGLPKTGDYFDIDVQPGWQYKLDKSFIGSNQLNLIRKSITSVPGIAGIGYGVYNMQQTQ